MKPRCVSRGAARVAVWILLLLAAGCAPFRPQIPPPVAAPGGIGTFVARTAMAEIGAPYRYGGADQNGFDCSGLVAYAYGQAGVAVPRTAAQQFDAVTRVPRNELQPGDLVFFALDRGHGVSHVGIYTGQDRFVHAPQSGRRVSEASLADPFYDAHFVGGGRFVAVDPDAAKHTAPR